MKTSFLKKCESGNKGSAAAACEAKQLDKTESRLQAPLKRRS
jgi:hypothetical protein